MSYILDALKRADAERERGAVPGLHARPAIAPAAQTAYRAQHRVWITVAVTLALAGMVAAGLWIWQTPDADVRLAAVEPAAARPPVPAPSAPPAPAPTTPAVAASPAAPQTVPAPAAPRAALSPPQSAGAPAASVPASRPAPAARAVAAPTPPRPKPAPAAKAAASQAAAPAVRLLGELPEDLRRQIPPLVITGSVYSNNPDKRLLLVNNQVLPQGSLAAPELRLEEIQAKSSVFSFRGTRFRVTH